jgi:Flp pilus assembly protein TadG
MAALMVVIIGMLAFSIDLGYISLVRGQMQSAADASALASASQLFDRNLLKNATTQDLTNANAAASTFAAANKAGGVSLAIATTDVTYGYIADPKDPSSPFDTSHTPYNSAKVKVQRTTSRNGELGLFFAKIFNKNSLPLEATATATYEGNIGGFEINPNNPTVNSKLLPYTVLKSDWYYGCEHGPDNYTRNATSGAVSSGGDGIREIKLFPTKTTPGNFGTVDIGPSNNSTSDIARQILYGPNKADFDAIGGSLELGPDGTVILEGDTGISAGVKDEMASIIGQKRIIPLYTTVTGNGNNSRYTVVEFVGCTVVAVKLTGGDKYIMIQPEFCVDPTAKGGGPSSDKSFAFRPLQLSR